MQQKQAKNETLNTTPKKCHEKYVCKICHFSSVKKSNLQTHFLTKKHIKNSKNVTKTSDVFDKKSIKTNYFCKSCKYSFNNRTALWRHNKKCNKNTMIFCCEVCNMRFNSKSNLMHHKEECFFGNYQNNIVDTNDKLIALLPKLTDAMIKITEKPPIATNCDNKMTINDTNDKLLALLPKLTDAMIKIAEKPSIANTNCNNKMTINMYLNEECKNAMNLTDFVNKVKVSLDDLMYTQQHGYVKGISNIFLKNLTDLDPKDRPIHCSDKKRMQFYVKEEDKWEKDKQHMKIDSSIAKITHKQILKIREWEDNHPDFLENDELTHIWQKMCAETMGGSKDIERSKNCINIKKEVSGVVEVKYAMKE